MAVRYRLYTLCGWSPTRATVAALPVRKWLLRAGAVALGLWLA